MFPLNQAQSLISLRLCSVFCMHFHIPLKAFVREIQEELDTKITVGNLIGTIEYDYPTFHLSRYCFWCEVVDGELKLLKVEDARWLSKENLYSVQWLPADITLIEKIEQNMI